MLSLHTFLRHYPNLPQKIDFYACKYDYYPQKYSTKIHNLEMLTDGDNKEDDYVKQ